MPPKRARSTGKKKAGPATKKARASPISAGVSRIPAVVVPPAAAAAPDAPISSAEPGVTVVGLDQLKRDFLSMFDQQHGTTKGGGVSNAALKTKFGESQYLQLVPIINELTQNSKLTMAKVGSELYYNLVSDEMASKFTGLDVNARMVYQVIEKAGNMGMWTKDIRNQTNIQQQALNKIFKILEGRHLIKPIKSVTAKSKKLYMAYDLQPAKEITGGPWYTELEFDHEFINELRTFFMHCVRKLNGGRGVTLTQIEEKMIQANVSRVKLSLEDVSQLMKTLVLDLKVEQSSVNERGEALFVAARRVTPMCEFKWWDVLCQDFHFRTIRFEDDVVLSAHEPHHHTS